MKSQPLLIVCLIAVAGLVLAGCPPPPPETSSIDIVLDGLTCDMCVAKVEKALAKVDGIREYTVDLQKKVASVTFESAKVRLSDIEQAIARAGFTANGTSRNSDAYEQLPACCRTAEAVEM